MPKQRSYRDKRLNRIKEDLLDLEPEEKEKMLDLLVGMQEDENEKRRQEIQIHTISEYTEEAKKIIANWGKVTGIRSGYPTIDSLTKGFDPGNLIVLAGRTSQYKTMLSINMARNIAKSGIPVMFVTLENTKAEIAGRLMKICGDSEEYEDVATMIAVQARDELDWRNVDALIESFIQLFNGEGIVFIDHLHYFARDTEKQAEMLGNVTKELKKNAIRHEIPIVLISHVRKAENKNKAKDLPDIEDLRGTSYIAQDADIVLMVGQGMTEKNNVVVQLQKNRNKGHDRDNDTTYLRKDPNGIRIY